LIIDGAVVGRSVLQVKIAVSQKNKWPHRHLNGLLAEYKCKSKDVVLWSYGLTDCDICSVVVGYHPEDGGNRSLRNVGILTYVTSQKTTRHETSSPWRPQIPHKSRVLMLHQPVIFPM